MSLPNLTQDTLTAAHRKVVAHCMRDKPREAVGLIWGDSVVTPLINESCDSDRRNWVRAENIRAAVDARTDAGDTPVLSIYHSHPRGQLLPSDRDHTTMKNWFEMGWDMTWTVVALTQLRVVMTTWEIVEGYPNLVHRLPCEYPLTNAY